MKHIARMMACILLGTLLVNGRGFNVWAKSPYPSLGLCQNLPRVDIKSPEQTCIGVVASDLKTPRGILPLSDDELWITEMGSWERNRGRLSRLLWNGQTYVRSTLLDRLDRPHGIVLANDGWVYVAQANKIIRLKVDAPHHVETVIDDLPDTGHHPLKQIVMQGHDLYISIGAETDHCERSNSVLSSVQYPCDESNRSLPTASIWRTTIMNGKAGQLRVMAKGLRNSMGLAISSSGQLIQTENSRDNITRADKKLNDIQLPHDEINVIRQGFDYGWPYCFDNNRLIPEYRNYRKSCIGKVNPSLFLPAHSAPLGMIQYPKNGSITALQGLWLVALHGYRETGHRVIGFSANTAGAPTGVLKNIVHDWGAKAKQPMGAPTEVRVSPSGSIYITDDRNDTVLRLSPR